jgi:hypothetical protein
MILVYLSEDSQPFTFYMCHICTQHVPNSCGNSNLSNWIHSVLQLYINQYLQMCFDFLTCIEDKFQSKFNSVFHRF